MAYGVAPKVQGTSMAPRQAAMGRALNKPKKGAYGSVYEPTKPDLPVNTTMGIGQPNHPLNGNKGPKYGLQPNTPGVNVLNQPTTNPEPGKIKNGVLVQPPAATPGTPGATTADPMGTGDPELDKYLAGDDTYQSILASIQRNKDLNKTNFDYNTANLNADNDTIKRRLAKQEVEDNALLDNDYAARGLFSSGLFAKADTDLGQNYANQNIDLATSLSRNLQQLISDQTAQDALDDETRRQAQLDAITRRAQEFGITGGPSNITKAPKKDDKKGGKKDGKKGGKK